MQNSKKHFLRRQLKSINLTIVLITFCFTTAYSTEYKDKNLNPVPYQNVSKDSIVKSITDPFGMCHAGKTKSEDEYFLLDDLGVAWLRTDFSWDKIEKQKGNFDFTSMDNYVNNAFLHNKKILGVLCYDASWLHPENERKFYIPPGNHDDFINYAVKIADRYKGKVAAFEIWNEPNNRIRDFWNGSDEDFFDLVKKTVNAIKKVDHEIIVVAPALYRSDHKYLKKMFEAGVLEKADVISFHPYSATLPGYNRQIERIIKVSHDFGFQKDFWITEMGYPTGGFYPWRTSYQKYPEKIIKALVCGLSKNIDKIFWYELFDGKKERWYNSEDHFGLIKKKHNYEYKEGAFAFRAVARNIANSQLLNTKVKCTLPKIQYFYFVKDNGEGYLIVWGNRKYRNMKITLHGNDIREVSIFSSNSKSVADNPINCSIDRRPQIFSFQLVKESNESIIIKKY